MPLILSAENATSISKGKLQILEVLKLTLTLFCSVFFKFRLRLERLKSCSVKKQTSIKKELLQKLFLALFEL